MENWLNKQIFQFISRSEKSPPLKKKVYILDIYKIIRLLLLAKQTMNRSFCGIISLIQ